MATIQDLQEELLLMIFSHYVRTEGRQRFSRNIPRVCKAWNELSSAASLWKNVKVHNSDYLLNVSRRGLLEHTQHLEIDPCEYNAGDDGTLYDRRFDDMDLSPVFKNIRDLKVLLLWGIIMSSDVIKHVTEHCPHLQRLRLTIVEPSETMLHEFDQFLTLRGPTLKDLDLAYSGSQEAGHQLVSGIASKCLRLETLAVSFGNTPFPIHELRCGCPSLKELKFYGCHRITTEREDFSGCGFKDLTTLKATWSDFSGFDIYSLIKDCTDLKHLELYYNNNLVFGNILKIPSEKVSILNIEFDDSFDKNVKALEEAVWKWRRTLSVLNLRCWEHNISYIFKRFFNDNPDPQLESLSILGIIDAHFLEEFIVKCQNLIHLVINHKEYRGRKKIKEALEFLMKEMTLYSKEYDSHYT